MQSILFRMRGSAGAALLRLADHYNEMDFTYANQITVNKQFGWESVDIRYFYIVGLEALALILCF